MNIQAILNQLSTEDKIRLCSGKDMWHLESFPELGIPEIMVTDGPHGLRKQVGDGNQIGIADSFPSTCLPTASLSACSWDKELLYQMGQLLGEEAIAQKVSVILGPGVNLKRNPRCGRNFEYFSEDPLLAGLLAASFIQGVQSQGIGTSLKHFAANNQEKSRMSSSSNIDPRALRELYLKPFEIAVKGSQPWTIMASYNKINGVHSSSNPWLLNTVLRDEWGFKGLVVSDWGAAHQRDLDLKAGLDLEMPGNGQYYLNQVTQALEKGSLKREELDRCTLRVLDLINKSLPALRRSVNFDPLEHHAFARKVAQESIVLLQNKNNILPLDPSMPIIVLGEFAETPRIQGSGSSKVNPYKTESFLDALRSEGADFSYRKGINLADNEDLSRIPEAITDITQGQTVVVFAGLTEEDEVEGFDRSGLNLPISHNTLITEVLKKTSKVIVILVGGAPVELPWADTVPAIINGYLPGEAGGPALADILYGKINPSGKLAETYPMVSKDAPSDFLYGVETKQVHYRESLFVGYRYFDSAKMPVRFPFGHGLSYTQFEYKDLSFAENVVSFTLTNTGVRTGSEIIQIYVSNQSGANFFAAHELKAFEKIILKAGESKVIHVALEESAFQYYDSSLERNVCANGIYEIQVGSSSRDLRLSIKITLESQDPQHIESHWKKLWYGNLIGSPTNADFESLTGRSIEADRPLRKGEFTLDASIRDMDQLLVGKLMRILMKQMVMKTSHTSAQDSTSNQFKVILELVLDMPLRTTVLMSQGSFSDAMANGIVDLANGKWISGIKKITQKTHE